MHPMCRVPLSSIQYTRTRHSVGQSVNHERNSRRVKSGFFFANGCSLQYLHATTQTMQEPSQAPQMAFPNQHDSQYQQPPTPQGSHQPVPMEPNRFANQQPFNAQMNTPLAGAPIPQQSSMQQQTFQPQQGPHPQMMNPQQQAQQANPQTQHQINMAPPLAQGQQPAMSFGEVPGGPSGVGDENAAGGAQESGKTKRKLPFKDRNLWIGGQSVVGRKGKDGEWMEVRCSVM
jgi:hypothetical protein